MTFGFYPMVLQLDTGSVLLKFLNGWIKGKPKMVEGKLNCNRPKGSPNPFC